MEETSAFLQSIPLYGGERAYPDADFSAYRYHIEDGIQDVALIDGLMMITCQDIPWNEDILQDWDFYDAFQSIAFLQAGLRVVVPIQKLPWFIHDDGKIVSLWNYDRYRKIFMEKYKNYLGISYDQLLDGSSIVPAILAPPFERL